jgi:hypothetical protein
MTSGYYTDKLHRRISIAVAGSLVMALGRASFGLATAAAQVLIFRTTAWDNLKRELRGVYADSVWEHLAGTVSEPFAAGEHRQIAVKVIDDRGHELMVVRKLSEAEHRK